MILPIIISVIFVGICVLVYFYHTKKEFFTKSNDRNKLVQYLKLIYPLTDWDNVSDKKVIKFYDSLGFVYNPCSEYLKSDLSGINNNCYDKDSNMYGQEVCGTIWYPLDICIFKTT